MPINNQHTFSVQIGGKGQFSAWFFHIVGCDLRLIFGIVGCGFRSGFFTMVE